MLFRSFIMISNLPSLSNGTIHLVPFYPSFVDMYFMWMTDKLLAIETDSEGITLEDVKDVQKRYHSSNRDFCFLIAYDPERQIDAQAVIQGAVEPDKFLPYLVGDVNLFGSSGPNSYEVNIMVADRKLRGKGIATAAMSIITEFAKTKGKNQIVAKINISNEASLKFFAKLGYKKTKDVPAFNQVEMIVNL